MSLRERNLLPKHTEYNFIQEGNGEEKFLLNGSNKQLAFVKLAVGPETSC